MELETLIQTERGTLVSRLALLLGGDHHAAEDLAQEAFARGGEACPRGSTEDSSAPGCTEHPGTSPSMSCDVGVGG